MKKKDRLKQIALDSSSLGIELEYADKKILNDPKLKESLKELSVILEKKIEELNKSIAEDKAKAKGKVERPPTQRELFKCLHKKLALNGSLGDEAQEKEEAKA